MTVVPLPADIGSHALTPGARGLRRRDAAGRMLITVAVDAHLLKRLLTLDASAEDH